MNERIGPRSIARSAPRIDVLAGAAPRPTGHVEQNRLGARGFLDHAGHGCKPTIGARATPQSPQ